MLVRIGIRSFPARNQEGEFLSNLVRILVEFETLAASLGVVSVTVFPHYWAELYIPKRSAHVPERRIHS